MPSDMQNPAVQGGAWRDLLGGRSLEPFTQPDWQTQLIAQRHRLPLATAALICGEVFGGRCHAR